MHGFKVIIWHQNLHTDQSCPLCIFSLQVQPIKVFENILAQIVLTSIHLSIYPCQFKVKVIIWGRRSDKVQWCPLFIFSTDGWMNVKKLWVPLAQLFLAESTRAEWNHVYPREFKVKVIIWSPLSHTAQKCQMLPARIPYVSTPYRRSVIVG